MGTPKKNVISQTASLLWIAIIFSISSSLLGALVWYGVTIIPQISELSPFMSFEQVSEVQSAINTSLKENEVFWIAFFMKLFL